LGHPNASIQALKLVIMKSVQDEAKHMMKMMKMKKKKKKKNTNNNNNKSNESG
jgi:hypothetical protein